MFELFLEFLFGQPHECLEYYCADPHLAIAPIIGAALISGGFSIAGKLLAGKPPELDVEGLTRQINEDFDRRLRIQLADVARTTRSRLSASGQSASGGAIDQLIRDNQNRLREGLETQRQTALTSITQFEAAQGLQAQQQGRQETLGFFGGLGDLGSNVFLSQQEGPFQGQLDQIQTGIQGRQNALTANLFNQQNFSGEQFGNPGQFSPFDDGAN